MKEKDKKFIEDWHFYHGKGKWLFIGVYGTLIGAIMHFLFSIIKFLFLQKINLDSFKLYFFTSNFLVEWLVSALFIGVFIGFVIWMISDKYYMQLKAKKD